MNIVITIISTIILAVTVLTLFLGILAYIVYKIKKRGTKKIGVARFGQTTEAFEKKPEIATPIGPSVEKPSETSSLIRRYELKKEKEQQAEWK